MAADGGTWQGIGVDVNQQDAPGESPISPDVSGAHGDFNYSSHLSIDDYAEDHAIGKAQTVAYVPGNWSATNLPPMSAIMAAYRAGHTIITDGPFVEIGIGIDTDGDGDWTGPADLVVGQAGPLPANTTATMHPRWSSLPEFGTVQTVKVLAVGGQWVEKGSYTVPWNGLDFKGQDLPSGVYLYAISTDQGKQTGKMSLVR